MFQICSSVLKELPHYLFMKQWVLLIYKAQLMQGDSVFKALSCWGSTP